MKIQKYKEYSISTIPYIGYRGYSFSSETKEDLYDQCRNFVNFKSNRGNEIRVDFLDDCKLMIEESKAVEKIRIEGYENEYQDSQYSKDGYNMTKVLLDEFIKSEKELLTKALEQLKILEEELKTME